VLPCPALPCPRAAEHATPFFALATFPRHPYSTDAALCAAWLPCATPATVVTLQSPLRPRSKRGLNASNRRLQAPPPLPSFCVLAAGPAEPPTPLQPVLRPARGSAAGRVPVVDPGPGAASQHGHAGDAIWRWQSGGGAGASSEGVGWGRVGRHSVCGCLSSGCSGRCLTQPLWHAGRVCEPSRWRASQAPTTAGGLSRLGQPAQASHWG
jgi:hypothetical protein